MNETPNLANTAFLSGAGAIGPTSNLQRLIYNTASGALFFDADGNLAAVLDEGS